MQTLKKFQEISPRDISQLLKTNYFSLMGSFYETQSSFLTELYKKHNSIETGNIILCFARNTHLEIIRQREKNLNFDVSLEKFFHNLDVIIKPSEKIISIVKWTEIPKETVRRKIKKLLSLGLLKKAENGKKYSLSLHPKDKNAYMTLADKEINLLAKFISKFTENLKLNLNISIIKQEIKSQFSFYYYHFLTCQLLWLKKWQSSLKDNDLLLIILQAIIPTIQYEDKNSKNINLENIFKIIGRTNNISRASISATTVSDVTKIPRATCIRKLEKLVSLGFLLREAKSKRYYVNQNSDDRTKNIIRSENVMFTIDTFSQFLAIIINSLIHNKK